MKLFWAYLHRRRGLLLGAALFCAAFAVSFALYHLPLAAVWYPALLAALAGFGLLLCDFLRLRRTHRLLLRIADAPEHLLGSLPDPSQPLEADYQEISRALLRRMQALQTADAAQYREMIEYYTVWAHQIKTPIAAMQLTLQSADTAQARQLRAELSRIEQYVEMVMTYLRLQDGASDYVFCRCALDPLIRQSVRRFSAEFIGRKIRLDYRPVGLEVVTDEKWLVFVLEQLLSNALKYTREGSIRIYLEAPATLCIADTGIGIAPEDLPRIFDRGYTGLNGRADRKASGLGLALCKRICGNLGASLSAESAPGRGTTVRLTLPQQPFHVE